MVTPVDQEFEIPRAKPLVPADSVRSLNFKLPSFR